MEDLRAIARTLIRHKGKLLTLLVLAGGLVFLASGAEFEFVSVSPDRTYRLEYYRARHYQRLLHRGNGRSRWLIGKMGEVAVGRDISFTGIPPVTASGDVCPCRSQALAFQNPT